MPKSTTLDLKEGWSTLVLLILLIAIAAIAIMQAELTAGTHILPIISTIAIIAGLLLAKSRFSANTAHLFADRPAGGLVPESVWRRNQSGWVGLCGANGRCLLASGLHGRLVYLPQTAHLAGHHSHRPRAAQCGLLLLWP